MGPPADIRTEAIHAHILSYDCFTYLEKDTFMDEKDGLCGAARNYVTSFGFYMVLPSGMCVHWGLSRDCLNPHKVIKRMVISTAEIAKRNLKSGEKGTKV